MPSLTGWQCACVQLYLLQFHPSTQDDVQTSLPVSTIIIIISTVIPSTLVLLMLLCTILCTVIPIVKITREHVYMDKTHGMNTNIDAFVANTTETTTIGSVVYTTADPAIESSV